MTSWLLRWTRPRLLVLTALGGTGARLAVERYAREHGWHLALTPAEANVLVTAGTDLEPYATRVWQTVPAPRVRVEVADDAAAPGALAAALTTLHDLDEQRRQARSAADHPAAAPPEPPHTGTSHHEHGDPDDHHEHSGHAEPAAHHERAAHHGHAEHTATDHGSHLSHGQHASHHEHPSHHDHHEQAAHHGHAEHTATDHGSHLSHGQHASHHEHADNAEHTETGHGGHSSHGGHDHHMAGMDMPGGVPMADRAPDRDGLMLDQLHVPLGPALPLWPPGLIVHTTLQGDVIQDASVERLDGVDDFWAPHPTARRLDACACLLALAGWTDAAVTAQRLRDAALLGRLSEAAHQRWAGKVRRSRTLRWLLAGLGTTPAGDALDRLHRWLDLADHETTVEDLPDLLNGTELAAARLIVASLGINHG
ncbi:hypothetical protein [Actinophytocola sp.]|uniref:hypothetical protein n=1 Tax=Actinophytocola sp. TaxID=1872138 RepID=UPI003899D58E